VGTPWVVTSRAESRKGLDDMVATVMGRAIDGDGVGADIKIWMEDSSFLGTGFLYSDI